MLLHSQQYCFLPPLCLCSFVDGSIRVLDSVLVHSVHRELLKASQVPGMVLEARNITGNKLTRVKTINT